MSDFKVKDLKLSDFGDREISLAETEMPGLMAVREEFKSKQASQRGKDYWLFTYDNSNCCFD